MKETKQRKAHLPEFKAKAELEALSGEKTVNPIGKLKVELDRLKKSPASACHDRTKMNWSKRSAREGGGAAPSICYGNRIYSLNLGAFLP